MRWHAKRFACGVLLTIVLIAVSAVIPVTSAEETASFSISQGMIAEGNNPGELIGDFQLTTEGTNPVYSLAGGANDNAYFTVSGSGLYAAVSFDYEAQDSFSVVVNVITEEGYAGQETFDIAVSDISPTAGNDEFTVSEEGTRSGTLPHGNDNTSISFSITADPGKGSVDLNTNTGAYTYTADLNETGGDSFSFGVSDGNTMKTGTVTVTITPVNDAPEIEQGETVALSCREDGGTETISLSATDADGDALTWALNSDASHGTATVSADTGVVSFTPDEKDYFGADSFTVAVSDGNGGSDSITVTVTVEAENDAPTFSVGENPSVDEDSGENTLPGWISQISTGADNETDQTVSFTVESNSNSSLFSSGPEISPDGTLSFTTAENAYGSAVIEISAADSENLRSADTKSFSITVNSVNDSPENTDAPQISGTPHNGQKLTASTGSWNDAADGAYATELRYAFQWQSAGDQAGPWNGIGGAADGTYTLTAAENNLYIRVAVTCTDSDTNPAADTAYSGAVHVLNEAPVIAQGDTGSLSFVEDDEEKYLALSASDADGDTLSWQIEGGSLGAASVEGGTVTYRPYADANGSDTFTVTVSDGNGGSDCMLVDVSIEAVNDIPTFIVGSNQEVLEDCGPQTVGSWISAMSAGATNESQTLLFTVEDNTNASLFSAGPAVSASGTLTYTPAANQSGAAVITLSVADSEGAENETTQSFTITVAEVNDQPVNTTLPSVSGSMTTGSTLTADEGVWNDDLDHNGGVLSYTCSWESASDGSGSNRSAVGSGWSYILSNSDSHRYIRAAVTVEDKDSAGTVTRQAFSEWQAVLNNSPSINATSPSITVDEDEAGTDTLSASDADSDTLYWSISAQAVNGTASVVEETGAVTYSPNADYFGNDSFSVAVSDGFGGTDQVTVTVIVNPVNDAPTFTIGGNQSVAEDSGSFKLENWITIMSPGSANENEQTLSFTVESNTNAGLFSQGPDIGADGTLTFTTAADANGAAEVTVSVTDSLGAKSESNQSFTITVSAVNDAPRNTSLPQISGTPHNGQVMTVSTGEWNDSADVADAGVLEYTYLWQSSDSASGPWIGIAGAAGSSYTLTVAENDLFIRAAVTCADNATTPESDTVYSDAVQVCNADPVIAQGNETTMNFNEDGSLKTLSLSASDSDGDALAWVISDAVIGMASIDAGTVSYQPNADANGTDTLTVTVSDGNGGSDSILITVTVQPVNDAPTFTIGDNQTVDEDCLPQTIDSWITVMSPGPANESGQTLTFSVETNTNPGLFSAGPAISPSGVLSFTPAGNKNGSADIGISVTDSEAAKSETIQSFRITVNPVNDLPVNTAIPTISGTLLVGNTVTASTGEWNDDSDDNTGTLAYTWQWQIAADDLGSELADLSAGQTCELTTSQKHRYIRAVVTVTNTDSTGTVSAQAFSDWYAVENTVPVIAETEPALATEEDTNGSLTLHAADADNDTLTWNEHTSPAHGTISVDPNTGEVIYSPNPDYNGSDSFAVSVSDGQGGTDTVTMTASITAVNDTPSFTAGADQTLPEDSTAQTVEDWISDMSQGPSDEAWQDLTFIIQSNDHAEYFSQQPSVSPEGTLTYTLAENAYGTATISLALKDTGDGANTSEPQVFSIMITPVNDMPSFTKGDDQSVAEDCGAITVPNWIAAKSVGPDNESAQTLAFTLSNDNESLFATQPSVSADGTLTYTPAADANGSAVVQIHVTDSGNTGDPGDENTSAVQTFTIVVSAVNDVPYFTVGADQTVAEDCGSQSLDNWITGIAAGPANESEQSLTFLVSVTEFQVTDNTVLFSQAPAISPEGTLTYTPAENAYGRAEISVRVQDNGGGTTDTSQAQSFVITVESKNDNPTFSGETPVETPEDTQLIYPFTIGDVEDAPSELTLAYSTDNTALLQKSNMLLQRNGANCTLTLSPEANRSGSVHITIVITDTDNGVKTQSITLNVTPENDAPTISAIENRRTNEDTSTGAIGFTIQDIDTDESACIVTAVSDNETLVPNDSTHIITGGGDANRTVSILPAQDQSGSAVITVTVSDGLLSSETSFTLTVDAVNDSPTISAIAAQRIDEDTDTGAIAFTVADIDNAAEDLTVTASANNTALVPHSNIALSDIQEDGTCTIKVTPVANYNGTTTVTLTVNDPGGKMSTTSFLLTVDPVNDPPTITAVADQTTNEDTAKSISVYIRDIDTDTSLLTLTAINSTNAELLPADSSHITISTATGTRTVNMIPLHDQNGETTVTLQVSDGGAQTAQTQFKLTVQAVNDTPYFTPGDTVTVAEDDGAVSITGWATGISTGAENETQTLTFNLRADIAAKFSVQPAIDPATGNLTFTLAPNANGDAVITVFLSDEGGKTSGSSTFTIQIEALNDVPVAYDAATGIDTDEDQQLKGSLHILDPDDEDTITFELVSGGEHNITSLTTATGGTVTLNASAGTFVYVPYHDYYAGPDSFSFRVFDGTAYSNTATVTIALTGINDPPVAVNGTMTVAEDSVTTGAALSDWVSDVDNTALIYAIVAQPDSGGTVELNSATGEYTYTPAKDYFGEEHFTFRAFDGTTYSNTATVSITVTSVNDAPVAQNIAVSLDEGQTLIGILKATDVEDDAITYSIVSGADFGTLILNEEDTGAYTYTPGLMKAEAEDVVTITYQATDTHGDSSTATLTITVRNLNDPPEISESTVLSLTLDEDTSVSGSVAATDPDEDTLVYTVLNNVNYGSLTSFDTATGAFVYTPNSNFHGTDYFTFIATEDRQDTETALSTGIYMVTLHVTSVNDAPIAYDLLYYTASTENITITPVGYDPDGNSLTYSIETSPEYSKVTNNNNGTFTFEPTSEGAGKTVTFEYKAIDSEGGVSENATVTVHIYGIGSGGGLNGFNDLTIEENTSTDPISVILTTEAGISSVSVSSSNTWLLNNDYSHDIAITNDGGAYSFILTPNLYHTGRTVIRVTVTDDSEPQNTYTRAFVLTVTHVYFTPRVEDLTRTIDENTEMYEYVSGVDDNGDTIRFAVVTEPTNGSLTFYDNGTFYYKPSVDFSGTDSFTFTASNGGKTSDIGTVTIHVTNVPQPPTAESAAYTIAEDSQKEGQLIGSGEAGAELVFYLVENAKLGKATVAENGAFTYTPDPNVNGTDAFTFKTEGPAGLYSSIAKVTLTITPQNDQPKAASQSVTTYEDQSFSGYVTGTDVDEFDTLTYALVETEGALQHGTLTLNQTTGYYTYTPYANDNGADYFYFKANDGTVDSEAALIEIGIDPVNDAPTVSDSSIEVDEDSYVNSALTLLYTDVDGDAQTFTTIQSPVKGTISFNTDGTFTYTPFENENGIDYFSYRTQDPGGLNSNVAIVTMTINPVNDAPVITADESWIINEDSTGQVFEFTVSDIEDDPNDLQMSGVWDAKAIDSLVFGGSGNTRWIKVTPMDTYQSTTTIQLIVTDTGTDHTLTGDPKTDSTTVTLTVLPVNDLPTVNTVKTNWTRIVDETVYIDEDTSTSAISFTVGDEESDAEDLIITASASNKALVPASGNYVITHNGKDCTITVTPAADQNGSSTIYIYVKDPKDTNLIHTAYFALVVRPVNDPPVVTPPDDQTISEDGATGDLYYTITDIDSAITNITVTAASDNETLVLSTDMELNGNARDRTIKITPQKDQNGDVTVTLTADDRSTTNNTGEADFTVHVLAVNDAPTIAAIDDVTIQEDEVTDPIPVEIADIDNTVASLTLNAISGNPSLVDSSGIVFTTDATTGQRYVTLSPKANANGKALITISVTDTQGKYRDESFVLTVTPVNDPPTITAIADQTILEDGKTDVITFNIADIDNDVLELTVTGHADGQETIIEESSFAFNGNGAERTVRITPLADQNGNIEVTLTVKDPGELTADSVFHVDIIPVNDEPSFTTGADQTVLEDCLTQTVAGWASNLSKGPANENGQTLSFHLENNNTDLFTADGQPTVDANGKLIYTPADNQYGTALVTVYLTDDGGTANGGDDTSDNNPDADLYADTFLITVLSVNDQPTFSALSPDEEITVGEDSGSYEKPWADLDSLYIGPESNETQTYHFQLALGTVTAYGNTELFSTLPVIDSQTGVIRFTPAENANGTAEVTVILQDDDGTDNGGKDTSGEHTFTLTVTPDNDDPTFTLGDPIVVTEDSGTYDHVYATGISQGGGTDELAQKLTFTLDSDNKSLFSVQPSMTADGELTFATAKDQHGETTVTISLDDETNTVTQSFTITVSAVNDQPSFTPGADQEVWEDCAAQTVTGWASNLNRGALNEEEQTLEFHVSNNLNSLFSVQPGLDANGNLTYTPAANQNGTAIVSVYIKDNGGTDLEGVDTGTLSTFTLRVLPVNDQPSFTDLGAITVNEDSGAYAAAWVQSGSMSAGPDDENTQDHTYYMVESTAERITNGNDTLFSSEPVIDADTGAISFTPAENASGSAQYTVYLQDSGGVERDGVDTSAGHPLLITVQSLNDNPTYTLAGNVIVYEDSGDYENALFATDITPGGGTDESEQPLTFTLVAENKNLFSKQPQLANNGTLTFTPAANAYGTTHVTVQLSDGDKTVEKGFTLTVLPVNDQPVFTDTGNITVQEDCGAKTIAWVSEYLPGPDNENQAPLFSMTETARTVNGNADLFSEEPVINTQTGEITFTPAANANGSVTFTVVLKDYDGTENGGIDTSEAHTLSIEINAVDDDPVFTLSGDLVVNEDSGAYENTSYATGITAGGGTDETAQTLTFELSGYNAALFSQPPVLTRDGKLTFTPAPDAHGSTTVQVALSDGTNTVTDSFTLTFRSVNDEPSFVKGSDQDVWEDCGKQTVSGWATGLNKGATNESDQALVFQISCTNTALFTADGIPAISESGTLTYTPAANAFGSSTVTVSLKDDGGTLYSGDDTSAAETFLITVEPVNDQPSFTDNGQIDVDEDCGAYSTPWVQSGSLFIGPSNEDQTYAFSMTEVESARRTYGNTSLFSVEPAINDQTGAVSFTPAENAYGTATYTVVLKDQDGTDRGGLDTSEKHTLVIRIASVNDDPTYTLSGDVTVNEDSGAYGNASFVSDITPGGGTDETKQPLAFTVTARDTSLFSTQPKISTSGKLTFTPAANVNGYTVVDVTLSDDENTVDKTFAIMINSVNDEPTFTKGSNQSVLEDCGKVSVPGWAASVSKGPDNEGGQTLAFTVTNDQNTLFTAAGQPAVDEDGTLTFTPDANAFGMATVTLSLSDNGGTANGGVDTSGTETFTIEVKPVNDQPVFTDHGNISVTEDSGSYASVWAEATSINPGPANEAQTYTFTMTENAGTRITNGNKNLFSAEPVMNSTTGEITFTPAANANGSAEYTVYLKDPDGTQNGGLDTSSAHTLLITVGADNDDPTVTLSGNVSVEEDSGDYSNSAFASGITPGGGTDETVQPLTFELKAADTALFSVQPALTNEGRLTFTPAADAFGSTLVTVSLSDDENTVEQSFTIEIKPVNDQPFFTDLGNITVTEDSGAYSASWVQSGSVTVGPSNEKQYHVFSMLEDTAARHTHGNTTLFSAEPSINSQTGVISFTPAPNAYGSASYTVTLSDTDGTENGGKDTSQAHVLTITITSENDAPTFTLGGAVTVNEDSGAYENDTYATGISSGGGTDESGETLTFTLKADDPSLFSEQPALSAAGKLTFTPSLDAFGSTQVTVKLSDGISEIQDHFIISVRSVNDRPTFTDMGDITVDEDSGAYGNAWANSVYIGPSNETQTYGFEILGSEIVDGSLIFADGPSIDADTGEIHFTPADNAFGSVRVTVVLRDNDGTDNGGQDTSLEHVITITVNAVNDAPSFTDTGDITVLEDCGAYSSAWAVDTSISAGADNELQTKSFQLSLDEATIVVTGNTELFSVLPSINAQTGEISFTPAENASGSAEMTVTLTDDGGTENGGLDTSVEHTFTLHITAVNDAPSFTIGDDVAIGAGTGPFILENWASDILAGPVDEASQTLHFNIVTSDPSLFTVLPAVDANGTLTFTPSDTVYGEAVVTITLQDDGGKENGGADSTQEQQFTITVVGSNQLVLTGTVYSAKTGNPIHGAKVKLLDMDGNTIRTATVKAGGVYRFDGLTADDKNVFVAASASKYQDNQVITKISFATNATGTITQDIPLSQFVLELSADPTTILGDGVSEAVLTARVTDETGTPVQGAFLTFSTPKGSFKDGVATTVTGSDGYGSVILISEKLSGTREQTIAIPISVSDDVHSLYGSATLYERFVPAFVQGIVTDGEDNNKPVKGAIVTVYKDFDGDGVIDFTETVTTGANGRYKIAVPRGNVEYNITIVKPAAAGTTEAAITFNQTVSVGSGSGSGNGNSSPSNAAVGVIKVKNEDGSVSVGGGLLRNKIFLKIEGNGENGSIELDEETGVFTANNLPNGSYTLNVYYELEDGSQLIVGSKTIVISDNGETNVNEILIDPYGIITDSTTGEPVQGATVMLYYANTAKNIANGLTPNTLVSLPSVANFPPADNANPQYSDAVGQYAFMVFPNTDYYIVATKNGYETYTNAGAPIVVGDSIVNFNFQMTPITAQGKESGSNDGAKDAADSRTGNAYDLAIYLSSDHNRMLENTDVGFTVTFGTKIGDPLPNASVIVRIPAGIMVADNGGGTELVFWERWMSVAAFRKILENLPDVLEKDLEHMLVWQANDLQPEEPYTRRFALHMEEIDASKAEVYQTLTASISASKPLVCIQDDLSIKTILIASAANTAVQNAYFPCDTGGLFNPDTPLTRAQAAAIFAAVYQLDTADTKTGFADVPDDGLYAGAIHAVCQAGIMKGFAGIGFLPERAVTRVEFIMLIARYLDIERSYYVVPLEDHFSDMLMSPARSTLQEVYRYGIVTPYSDGTFRPYQAITRAEAAVMLNRTLCRGAVNNAKSLFSDVPQGSEYCNEVAAAAANLEVSTDVDGNETAVAWPGK